MKAPLAWHARHFLEFLSSGAGLEDVLQKLKPLLNQTAEVSRTQRLVLLASTWLLSLPVLALLTITFGYALLASILTVTPEIAMLRHCLYRWDDLRQIESSTQFEALEERRAIEIYIAGRFSPLISGAHQWRQTRLAIPEKLRREAHRVVKVMPAPSEDHYAWARTRVEPRLESIIKVPGNAARMARERGIPLALRFIGGYSSVVLLLILPCLASSLLFRGGMIIRMSGIHFVTRHGTLAPRWRVTGRYAIAWMPFLLLLPAWLGLSLLLGEDISILTLVSLGAALAVVSAWLPQRGLPDRLTGLWPVPH